MQAFIVEAATLASMVPDGRDLRILTHIGSMINNKEFSQAFLLQGRVLCAVPYRGG
jgi:hypothetical protein